MAWVNKTQPEIYKKLQDLLFVEDITFVGFFLLCFWLLFPKSPLINAKSRKVGLKWAPGEAGRRKMLDEASKNIIKVVETATVPTQPGPKGRLQVLIRQAVDRQAHLCSKKNPNHTKTSVTLYVNHSCEGTQAPHSLADTQWRANNDDGRTDSGLAKRKKDADNLTPTAKKV
jgi:hypothetical protein